MRSILTFLLSSLSLLSSVYAQTVTGNAIDSRSKEPMEDAKILFLSTIDSSLITGTTVDEKGTFEITLPKEGDYLLKATSFGYLDVLQQISIGKEAHIEINIALTSDTDLLDGVTIEAVAIRVQQSGDTTIYNADQFKVHTDASVEELITKMPGITYEDGVYKSRGQEIKKILIDGEEFFGEDAQLALKNLPAEIVSKIQTFEQESEQARFTGISDGDQAMALNIVTKTGSANGQFGKIYGGWGPMDKYLGGANLNFFKGKRKISVIAMSNNINQQNFSSEDILGATANNTTNTSGGRGNRGSGATDNFMIGSSNGIATSHALGINYTDKWKEKTKVTGSYFFNYSSNKNEQNTAREYFLSASKGQLYNEMFSAKTGNQNHRLNFKFDIQLDSMNALVITPKLSYQRNQNRRITTANTVDNNWIELNSLNNRTTSLQDGITASNGLLWRHKFSKPKRTLSTNLNLSFNNKLGDNSQYSLRNFYDNGLDSMSTIDQIANNKTLGYGAGVRISFTEPLSSTWTNEVYYAPSYSASDANKVTLRYDEIEYYYSVLDTALSNVFLNHTLDNQIGTNFRWSKDKHNLQMGMAYQNSMLFNIQEYPTERNVRLNFNSILPNLQYRFKINNTSNFSFNYRARTRNPQINQLQNVLDNSNPLKLSSGNPDLKQQYAHSLTLRYNATFLKNGSSFFAYASGEIVQNQITNANYIAISDTTLFNHIELQRGAQFRLPVNINGTWNTRAYVSYGIPLKKMKSNFNINAGANYGNTPSLINDTRNNSKATSVNAGLSLNSNISEKIDFSVSYTFAFSDVNNTNQPKANNQYFTQNIMAKVNYMPFDRLVLNTNFSARFYKGLTQEFNQSILLWNAGIGYKLLKNKALELRISAFDILNNNNSIVRNTTEMYIEDVQSLVINRYFMLTATYTLRNFGQAKKSINPTQTSEGSSKGRLTTP